MYTIVEPQHTQHTMYAKLFRQMYDGTLATNGPWEALVTFQQLLVLANDAGEVDMTAAAIARTTTIPADIITRGIAALCEPDPDSRTPDEGGRRLVLLSDGRSWGWRIVNYAKYRAIRKEEDRREYHRRYWHEKRSAAAVTQRNSTDSTDSTHTEEETEEEKEKETLGSNPPKPPRERKPRVTQGEVPVTLRWSPPPWVPSQPWAEFEEMRKAMPRVPFTDAARNGVVRKLQTLVDAGHDPAEALQAAVTSGWRTVYPPKAGGGLMAVGDGRMSAAGRQTAQNAAALEARIFGGKDGS